MSDHFEIRHEREHYAVFIDGVFHCSADTAVEAANEIEKYIEEKNEAVQLDWTRAVEHVRDIQYETYSPASKNVCKKLLDRYHKGERSRDLYERMMSVY